MEVKVLRYRAFEKNTLRAFCDIEVNGLKIKDCTHHKKDDSDWISFPSKSYEVDGQTKWTNILEWTDKVDAWKFQDAARVALAQHLSEAPEASRGVF